MTTDANQKPSIEEQYACAVMRGASGSSLFLAAGMQRDRAGVLLLRLRAEYDTVRGELERAGQIAPSAATRVRDLIREADKLKTRAGRLERLAHTHANPATRSAAAAEAAEARTRAADLIVSAGAIERRTPADVKTARAVVLVALTTLHDARQELGALAIRMLAKRMAANPRFLMAPAVALQLAGRVLDVWLDETCHKCDGTGILGSRYQGDAERECPACKGSGHRRDILGDSMQQSLFARDLLSEVQRQVGAAAAGIKAAIHADTPAPAQPAPPELTQRLADLRGAEAAAD